jgi:hypothetical protein
MALVNAIKGKLAQPAATQQQQIAPPQQITAPQITQVS